MINTVEAGQPRSLVLAVYAVEVDREAREFLQRTLQDYPEPGENI
jgi:hypothetical protein